MRWLALVVVVGCAQGRSGDSPDAAPVCTLASCDDQNACTSDSCDPIAGCAHVAISCDDHDACTTDTCDPAQGCAHDRPHGTQTFDVTNTIETFSVPSCVLHLHIKAAGGQGGAGQASVGGKGATLEGDFTVTPNQVISILVGSKGADSNTSAATPLSQRGGTGGGGTFVVAGTTILVIAGGGGGASGLMVGIPPTPVGVADGGPGQITMAGQAGGAPSNAPGGTGGGGGGTFDNTGGAYQNGTGGGGYSGDGIGASTGDATTYGTPNQPGSSYINRGVGGIGGSQGRDGGFGGGGAAGYTGGGGGGYSGGGAGPATPAAMSHAGGGGGSINNGTNVMNISGDHTGNGQVVITW